MWYRLVYHANAKLQSAGQSYSTRSYGYILKCNSRGCQCQAIENAPKSQSTTLKTYGKLSWFIFLTLSIFGIKRCKILCFMKHFYRSLESSQVQALKNTVNVWDQMSRVTSRSLEQFGWSACGKMHFRWLALKGLPPWRILDDATQTKASYHEFEKQIYWIWNRLKTLCNGIWQKQLLILKFG